MRFFALLLIGELGCHSSSPVSFDGRGADSSNADSSAVTDSSIVDGLVDAPDGNYAVARSGSRLKLTWWQTADGVRSPSAQVFYDSLLAQSCSAAAWTDSSLLCTPQYTSADSVYAYTDAACTAPVISGGPYPAGTYFAALTQPPALCGRTLIDHMVAPGAAFTPAPIIYYKSGTTCTPGSSHGSYFQVASVSESTFVPITINYDATGNLQQMHWDSPDGMRWYRPSGNDTVLGTSCLFEAESGTTAICDPRGAMIDAWSDAACAVPLTTTGIGCAPSPYAATEQVCSNQLDRRVFAVGAQTATPNPAYINQSCSPSNPDIHSSYYAVGATAVGNVQTMTRSALATDPHRLKAIFFDSTTGLHYQTGYFFDSMLNMECAFGGDSCGPVATATTKVLYTDSSCANAFDAVEVDDDPPSCNSTPAAPPSYGIKVLGVGMREFHRVTNLHTAVVYENTGECRRYPEMGIPQSWQIFEVDSSVTSPSAFESATVVIDP